MWSEGFQRWDSQLQRSGRFGSADETCCQDRPHLPESTFVVDPADETHQGEEAIMRDADFHIAGIA